VAYRNGTMVASIPRTVDVAAISTTAAAAPIHGRRGCLWCRIVAFLVAVDVAKRGLHEFIDASNTYVNTELIAADKKRIKSISSLNSPSSLARCLAAPCLWVAPLALGRTDLTRVALHALSKKKGGVGGSPYRVSPEASGRRNEPRRRRRRSCWRGRWQFCHSEYDLDPDPEDYDDDDEMLYIKARFDNKSLLFNWANRGMFVDSNFPAESGALSVQFASHFPSNDCAVSHIAALGRSPREVRFFAASH